VLSRLFPYWQVPRWFTALHRCCPPPRGLFASRAKFDQLQARDIPYATLAPSLPSLMRPLLGAIARRRLAGVRARP